jgi:hypothetical protein
VVVRRRATEGLSVLMALQPRVDPVVTELLDKAQSVGGEVGESVVSALAAVVRAGGKNITPPVKSAILEYLEESFAEVGSRGDFSFSFSISLW